MTRLRIRRDIAFCMANDENHPGVKELIASRDMDVPNNFYAIIEQQLDEDGKCQVDLNDGCSVSCVLYRDDAKNIKE